MSDHYEIAIVGAGPGGMSAAANAAIKKMSHVLFEKAELGNTIFDYQLRKHVMAAPDKLPIRSEIKFEKGSRESVLDSWNRSMEELGVNVRQRANISKIESNDSGFKIQYGENFVTADSVVLAIGAMGIPRPLGAPGEDLPHVNYRLGDPDAFEDMDIIVVGAGDAAIENALALAGKNRVSLINRKGEFARAKDENIALIREAIDNSQIRCFYHSTISRVEEKETFVNTPEGEVAVTCNHLIARLGGIMPRKFLESCGIEFPSSSPAAVPVVDSRYESNVKGLHLIGSLIGYPLIKQAINQGHEVVEHILGNEVEPADQVLIEEKLGHLKGGTNENLKMIRNSLSLFRELSEPQFREMISESTVHENLAGKVVFKRNDFGDTFFSIVSGSVKVELPNGSYVEIPSDNFFGEMGLLSGRRRSATIQMGDGGILLEVPRKQMLKLISSVESVKRPLDESFMVRALQSDIFPNASFGSLKKLVSKASLRPYKKGDVLFKEGDEGESLFVIRKGSVKISRLVNGVDITQTYLSVGNYVGEMSILGQEARSRCATVTAAVGCEMIVIGKNEFLEFLEENPETSEMVSKVAEQRRIQNVTFGMSRDSGELLDFMLGKGLSDADNVLLIDSDLCVGCDNCEKACAGTHDGFSRLDRKGGESFSSIQVPTSCRHCENPLCMTDCPPDALTRRTNGEIIIKETCIGCGNCEKFCPYGVIQMVYDAPKQGMFSFFTSLFKAKVAEPEKKAAKCDLCTDLKGGPACVRSCPTGAAMRVNPEKMLELTGQKG